MALVGNAVRPGRGRAYTLAELLVALLFLALVFFALLPMLARTTCGGGSRQIKCGTQVRNVIQAMTIFAQGNKDRYPLPSMLDVNNQTVAAANQRDKDTTNHVLSILVFDSSISPELLVSPSETNSAISCFSNYQSANPAAAVVPANAVWDPALRCDFTSGAGHVSYALSQPSGNPGAPLTDAPACGRLKTWSLTFNALEPVVGNRGPLVSGRDKNGDPIYDNKSNTMGIHGGRTTWEGNIGYNDNHVNFETRINPAEITYRAAGGRVLADCFFYDEADDTTGVNSLLGIWIKAGDKPGEFKGIHD